MGLLQGHQRRALGHLGSLSSVFHQRQYSRNPHVVVSRSESPKALRTLSLEDVPPDFQQCLSKVFHAGEGRDVPSAWVAEGRGAGGSSTSQAVLCHSVSSAWTGTDFSWKSLTFPHQFSKLQSLPSVSITINPPPFLPAVSSSWGFVLSSDHH